MISTNNNNKIYIFKSVFTSFYRIFVKRNFIKPNNHVVANFVILGGGILKIFELFGYKFIDRTKSFHKSIQKVWDLVSEYKFEEGLVLCNKLIEWGIDEPMAYWVRGSFYRLFNKYGKSKKDFEKVLELTSRNQSDDEIKLRKSTYRYLAEIQVLRGDKDYAIDILLEAIDNKNQSPEILLMLSELYKKKEEYGLGFVYAKFAYDLLDEKPKDLDDLYTRYQYVEKMIVNISMITIYSESHQEYKEHINKLLTLESSIEISPKEEFKLSEAFQYIYTYSLELMKRVKNLLKSKQIENEDELFYLNLMNALIACLAVVAEEGIDILNSDLYNPLQFTDESKNPFISAEIFLEMLNTIISDLFTNKE